MYGNIAAIKVSRLAMLPASMLVRKKKSCPILNASLGASMVETVKEAARRLSSTALKNGFQPAALHTYTDSEGNAIYWRIRAKNTTTGEKWIRPMRLNGNGYELGDPAFEGGKPLYALHLIAGNPGSVVWIVEGEQKADAINQIGLVATTSGGAMSAGKADWTPLRGRNVVIWPDFDDAGRAYANDVAIILNDLNCTVLVIDVSKLGLSESQDVIDWLSIHPEATATDITDLPLIRQENVSANDSDDWPEPQPLTAKIEPKPYPIESLPAIVKAAVDEVYGFVKAPIPLVAASAISALSLAIQTLHDVERAKELHSPTGLFLLTIADSGERKSTCDRFFTKAIIEYEDAQAEAAKPEIKNYKADTESWEAKRWGFKDKIRNNAKDGKPTTSQESELRLLEQNKPEPPRIPRLIYVDATPEALAYSLAKQWPSGGVVSAEGGIVFGSHGMGKDSVMRNLAMLNQLWDGANLKVDRRTSESFIVSGARLTVALQVQPETLKSFFEKSGALARGTGFLARFLISWPESMQGHRLFTEAPESWPQLAKFNRRIEEILNIPAPIRKDSGGLTPMMLTLTPEAKSAWINFHDGIEVQLFSGGVLFDVRDVASKIADNATRLAALFHVFEGVSGAISVDAFERASAIVAWHLHESRRFFGELALPAELTDAVRLNDWLIQHCKREHTHYVTKRHAQQYGTIRDTARFNAAIAELEALDRIRIRKDEKKISIWLNPKLLTQEAA
ncbi:YfjI family protein [Nitrosomonas oligotropha]|uniref:YfjI family protein n=1 Tax=Nitrosomonas oligotropha TaxID=42354 RepID=UPI0013717359|nr:YfjI family protein [Nitrosomonas oligotropha]MXS81520.1 DUF3987 domain-containing protein [Nitrosomonas oligotropha]